MVYKVRYMGVVAVAKYNVFGDKFAEFGLPDQVWLFGETLGM